VSEQDVAQVAPYLDCGVSFFGQKGLIRAELAFEMCGSQAWIRTRVHATTLSLVGYEPWFESRRGPKWSCGIWREKLQNHILGELNYSCLALTDYPFQLFSRVSGAAE
jgi:hypothetical protein